jgi:hypothetical protein
VNRRVHLALEGNSTSLVTDASARARAVLLAPEVFVYSYDPASFPTASILSGNFVPPFP